jgi:UDPglucose--hexose-1-phosphate uridylyltransferase
VAIAPARAHRPGAARAQLDAPSQQELESCPFCAGHEDRTPPQTLVLPAEGRWRIRVVPNLYPALDRQEVVVHTREHARSIAELDNDQLALVTQAWQERRRAESDGYLHALINEGREAGSSLPHTHSQLAWLPSAPPPEPPQRGETILEGEGLIAWCPWVSRLPYESAIAPVAPEPDGLTSALLADALQLLAELVRRLHALEGAVPLNVWLHNHATGWRLVLLPRLTVLAGLELGAGVYVNTLLPEEAAKRLREADSA